MMRSNYVLLSAYLLCLSLLPSTAFAQTGALTQLSGTDGCISGDGTGGDCADGVGLDFAIGVAVSNDGRNVYVAATGTSAVPGAVAVFARDRRTGALTQLPGTDACVSEDGTGGESGGVCADGVALFGPRAIAVSSDGRNVYVAAVNNAVAVLARDGRTGALTQLPGTDACISDDGTGGDCTDGGALGGPFSVTVSRDGRNVYVASNGSGVAVFARDGRTGALTQLAGTDACVSEDGTGGDCADGVALDGPETVAVSPDGRNVYVGSSGSSAVAVFARDRRTGALSQLPGTDACISDDGTGGDCTDGVGLIAPHGVAVSHDGRNVYVAGGGGVAVFARDRRTGALSQLPEPDACINDFGSPCAQGIATGLPISVAVSLDGRNVYVASNNTSAVTAFARDRRTGALTQLPEPDACVSEDGTGGPFSGGECGDGVALNEANSVAVSPNGRNVYVASFFSSAVAVFARDRSGPSVAAR